MNWNWNVDGGLTEDLTTCLEAPRKSMEDPSQSSLPQGSIWTRDLQNAEEW
jgi:hypothetical protein